MPEIERRESWLFERRIEGRISGTWLDDGCVNCCGGSGSRDRWSSCMMGGLSCLMAATDDGDVSVSVLPFSDVSGGAGGSGIDG